MAQKRNTQSDHGGVDTQVQMYGTIGTLAEFKVDGDWLVYQERMEQYFLINMIPEERKVHYYLCSEHSSPQ